MRFTHLIATLALALTAVTALTLNHAAAKQAAVYVDTGSKLAVSGYDPVAYFAVGKPVKGNRAFTSTYQGAQFAFTNAANKATFDAEPAKYAPQFGGYCSWAVSQGYTASADPEAWKIVGGKLYLNYSPAVAVNWATDVPGNIAKGNANWPTVLDK
jgi:YHS domain-containing protein